jgi:hypothetical protein
MLVALVGVSCAFVPAADAAGTREGDVTIVDIDGSYGPLTHGGSATEFSLRLPADANCPGDSKHDQWRVQSFMVPASMDPAGFVYALQGVKGLGPNGETLHPIFDIYTHPVSQVMLRPNSVAGQIGQIDAMPPMSYEVFTPGMIRPGAYKIGLACTYFRETAKYWDTQIVITASASDRPAGFVWRLSSAPESVLDSGDGFPWVVVGGLVLLAVAAVVVALGARAKHRVHSTPLTSINDTIKEMS